MFLIFYAAAGILAGCIGKPTDSTALQIEISPPVRIFELDDGTRCVSRGESIACDWRCVPSVGDAL